MNSKLIIALDFNNEHETLKMVDRLDPAKCSLKVGSELYTLFGPQLVKKIIGQGFQVFLDLKFHDIPNTVSASCRAAADLGVWMFNVHASGGSAMLESAASALSDYGKDKPLLIAVTVLTSMDINQYHSVGFKLDLSEQVRRLSQLAFDSGLDGVVCSALDVQSLKKQCGKQLITVTPGIRPADTALDDQSRVMTPHEAVKVGSDYLVVGRPITRSPAPQQVVDQILDSIQN